MASRFLLNPIKYLEGDILTNVGRNRVCSRNMYDWSGINMLIRNRDRRASISLQVRYKSYSNPTGNPGCGAGRGGGAGGSVRESGGGLGQFGAAQEEQFFFNKQREQLKAIKKKILERKNLKQKKEKIRSPPDTINEEGYFTQRARQQLEELKKKLEKPKVENTEKKE
ncbi:unnamed protein product [Danaus chrysippus]|uniref:(African queen) hypothetical protein n=1 Tax=Danaus chrysippus TaxID=151541 RepID=A0A8J2QXV5_9NEOP|nr:unnamed protein product [Danaus chrysippus]